MKIGWFLEVEARQGRMIEPGDTVQNAARQLSLQATRWLIVSPDGVAIEGLIGERDIVDGVAIYGSAVEQMPVSSLMQADFATCSPDVDMAEAVRVMIEHGAGCVAVVDEEIFFGVATFEDVVRYFLATDCLRIRNHATTH